MRAVVHDRYGPPEVLSLEEVERPVVKADEVLVRVRATTVTRSDCHYRSAKPFISRFFTGLRRPRQRILGTEMAGEGEAVGPAVTEFAVGDRVFGTPLRGAFAEVVAMPARRPLPRPPGGLSFGEAGAGGRGASAAVIEPRPAE